MLQKHAQLYVLIISSFLALLAGCGGGGGGSGSSNTITYSGITTQAAITQTNGEEIATESYQNGGAGSALAKTLSVVVTTDSPETRKPRLLTLTNILDTTLNQISVKIVESNLVSADAMVSAVTVNENFPGSCGGTVNYNLNVNEKSGSFSGTFNYNNYCEDNETVNGSMDISGIINLNTLQFAGTLSITFNSFSIVDSSDSYVLKGNITTNYATINSDIFYQMEGSLTIKDNNDDQTYLMENFIMTITEGLGYEDVVLTGRFYDPDNGYVNLTTPTPMHYEGSNEFPSSGAMIATGANGTGGNSSTTTLTALSSTTYQIDIDEDGDGLIDSTDTGNWEDL